MLSKTTIIGNLTKNPELRTTQSGINVCSFTVAVNRPKTQNNPDPDADFFNVTAWWGLGDICAKYLEKGKKVCVVGRVSLRTWDTQDGRHGASLELLAEDIEFLSVRTETGTTPPPSPTAVNGFQEVETDELPF